MKYSKEELRAAAGVGDETGPPTVTRGKRAIGSKPKRQAKRKYKR
jgi:hypothetical protein